MMELLMQLTWWHWWILALVLMGLEIFAPGAFMIWIGIAAGIVGTLMAIFPGMPWALQAGLFALFSILSMMGWKRYSSLHPQVSDEPLLNRRGAQYVGREFTLSEPIENGRGKVTVDDSTWPVKGTDAAAGVRVRVVAVDGSLLQVEPLE